MPVGRDRPKREAAMIGNDGQGSWQASIVAVMAVAGVVGVLYAPLFF
jgi:hypothetical protein